MPVKVSDEYEEVLGYAEMEYQAMFYDGNQTLAAANNTEYDICGLLTSKENLVFKTNGYKCFVDIVGVLSTGGYVNLSSQVEYHIKDEAIVEFSKGRIYAKNKGNTTIEVSYKGYKVTLYVEVIDFFNFDVMLYSQFEESNLSAFSLVPSQIIQTMTRANGVAHVRWTAKKKFRLNDGTYAEAGTVMEGMPYTQSVRCTVQEFLDYHAACNIQDNGFYRENLQSSGYYWASYGIDCSGLICIAWNIPFDSTKGFWDGLKNPASKKYEKVGSYEASGDISGNSDREELKTAYASLKPGDAIVKRVSKTSGHARLVTGIDVSEKRVYCLEAEGNFPENVIYTFDELAEDYYCPFVVKSDYYDTGTR
mgnify:CR=1 FL=1